VVPRRRAARSKAVGDATDPGDTEPREEFPASTAAARGRTAALMHLLTDLPDDQIRAAIDKLPREERARLDELAAEIFKDHTDLFGPSSVDS
jgi:hypothetical protein